MSDTLRFKSLSESPNAVSPSVLAFSQSFPDELKPQVAEIDPEFTGSKEFCEHYGVDPNDGANCIIVEVVRGEHKTFACCLVPIATRADLNNTVRKHFNARRVSFAPLDQVVQETAMEYGSITPFGLPATWPILVDSTIMRKDKIIIGGGKVISKLLIQIETFKQMKNVESIEGLGK